MKKILSALALVSFTLGFAQLESVNDEVNKVAITNNDTIDGWKTGGTFTFLLNQSAFSNWIAGGTNSVAGNVGVNYDFNYKKGDWSWDNKLILAYGLSKLQDQDLQKTDDRIEFNSLVGRKAFKNWSYSFFLNFRTQFSNGFDYGNDVDRNYATSGFFKPAYLTFGPGLMWKKHDNLKFNLAPITSKVTFLSGEVWQFDGTDLTVNDGWVNNDQVMMFGVEPGKSSLYQLGFYASGYYKAQLMENVTMENILSLYSNYLKDPQNIDIDYTMNLVMQINKYLSTNLAFQTIYDDDAYPGFQVREVFGLGVNFNF